MGAAANYASSTSVFFNLVHEKVIEKFGCVRSQLFRSYFGSSFYLCLSLHRVTVLIATLYVKVCSLLHNLQGFVVSSHEVWLLRKQNGGVVIDVSPQKPYILLVHNSIIQFYGAAIYILMFLYYFLNLL